jgi:cell division septation protein DedD
MESQDPKEEKLLDELETMYHRVAESEKSEPDSQQTETLQSYYESLQVSPDSSLDTIKESYKRLVDFWDPAQFADNPSLREKAEWKLTEITHAYEKIVAFRKRESGPPSAQPPIPISEEPDLSFPDERAGHHFPWGKILVGGASLAVVVLAVSYWPTFYHYDKVLSGDKTYQVRTNRITGSMTYFDGAKWNNPPIPTAPTPTPLPLPALTPPAEPPALSVKQPIPAPVTEPGPAEGPKVASEKEAPSEKQDSQPAQAKGYAIQVSAMRDLNMAKEFVETQNKSQEPQVYLAKIRAKDGGVWYRVYIGRFADKAEAARYMKEKKIKEFFPECFIQKLS